MNLKDIKIRDWVHITYTALGPKYYTILGKVSNVTKTDGKYIVTLSIGIVYSRFTKELKGVIMNESYSFESYSPNIGVLIDNDVYHIVKGSQKIQKLIESILTEHPSNPIYISD